MRGEREREGERERHGERKGERYASKLLLDRSTEFGRVRLGNRVSRVNRAPLGWKEEEE